MDTNKIREAQALIDEARHRGHNIPQLVEAARLLKAELDAAPKVFTDEEIERVASMCCPGETSQIMQASVPNGPIPLSQGENIRRHIVMALRYARDNDYLAPAAGLTEPVAWMVTTRIGSEYVDTMTKTREAAWQIAIERYRNKSGVEHADPVPLYLAPAAGLTVEEIVRIAGDWFNHVVLDMSAGDDAASDLRTRLTAAIEAKQNRKA